MFEIIVYRDGAEQARYPLAAGASHLGRAEGNEIVLPEDAVSRRHARFVVEGNSVYVEDLDSGNGTYISGQRIEGRQELQDGSEVQVTPFMLKLHVRGAPPAPEGGGGGFDDVRTQLIQTPKALSSEPERTGARLILRRGEAGKSSYMLTTKEMSVGRSEDRDIVLTDPASSRRHATITFQGDRYHVKDEGSANGLVVNNEPTRDADLLHGDRLIIGETEFELIWPGAPQAAGVAAMERGGGIQAGDGTGSPVPGGGGAQDLTDPSAAPHEAGPQQEGGEGGYGGGVDPYSETGIMPSYDALAVQQQAAMAGGGPAGYPAAGGGYGVELGSAPVRKRSPLLLVIVLLVVVLGAAIGIKVVSDRGSGEQAAIVVPVSDDPCAGVGDNCQDSTDQQVCKNCLQKRARLTRGRELFTQKEFSQAIQEFQRILQDIDPLNHDAMQLRYISYEFWVLTAIEDTLRDRSQTVSQKLERMEQDFEKAKHLVERYSRGYSKNSSDATLSSARANLNEAVRLFNDIVKINIEDEKAETIKAESESLRSKALNTIYRLKSIRKASKADAFVQEVADIFNRGMTAKANGNLSRASALFKDVIKQDPNGESGLVSKAQQEIETINRAMKDRARPLYNEALGMIRNGQLVGARSKLKQALKIDPEFAEAQAKYLDVNRECVKRAKKLYSEAKVQYNIGKYPQAEKLLNQVVEYAPDSNESVNQKANKMLKDIAKH